MSTSHNTDWRPSYTLQLDGFDVRCRKRNHNASSGHRAGTVPNRIRNGAAWPSIQCGLSDAHPSKGVAGEQQCPPAGAQGALL